MYSICYWEVCMHFFRWRERFFVLGGIFTGRIYQGDRSFQGVSFSDEIFTWTIRQNSYTKFSYVFLSLYRLDFARGHVEGNCPR